MHSHRNKQTEPVYMFEAPCPSRKSNKITIGFYYIEHIYVELLKNGNPIEGSLRFFLNFIELGIISKQYIETGFHNI